MGQTWSLENVINIGKECPYTFYLPSGTVLSMLKVGDAVKLMFNCEVENDKGWSAERMWVQITERERNSFKGFLDNEPYYIPDIKAGDIVEFSIENIMQTDLDDPEPSEVGVYTERCFVTGSILNDKNLVHQLYREEPDDKQREREYSGWTLLSGLESEDYLNDSNNWYYVSLGSILNIDDRFKCLLNSEYETEYVWDENSSSYKKI